MRLKNLMGVIMSEFDDMRSNIKSGYFQIVTDQQEVNLFLLDKIEKMEKTIKEIVEVIAMMNHDKLLEMMQNSGGDHE